MKAAFIKLTRPDGGDVYMRCDAIDRVMQPTKERLTEVHTAVGVQSVKESAEDIIRVIS